MSAAHRSPGHRGPDRVGPPFAVLFDMDGTIFDSEKLWDISLEDLAAHLGGSLSPAARQSIVGMSLRRSIRLVHDYLGVDGDADESGLWLLRRTKELFAAGMPARPGALELLAAVRREEIPTACVTSTHRELTDVALATLPAGSFDVTVCGDEVECTKPDPESYLTAAVRLGIDPAACVAIEDSPPGVDSAQAAGCAVLAVPSELPIDAGPGRVVIESLVGITPTWLRELPARIREGTVEESRPTRDTAPGDRTSRTAVRG